MMAREASVYTGLTVAEYFRDMGLHAVVIADSTSRWAEALREFASRSGALPAEEGYPASLGSALAAFYERAGHVRTLGGRRGSVTVIGAVSPPGGDVTEPVTANTERFVRSVWSLDRDLAYARHYPAVSWTSSFSRDAGPVGAWHAARGDPEWARRRGRVLSLVADADRLTALADLVGMGSLPGAERMVLLTGRLLRDAVLQQSALSRNDAVCSPQKGAALVDAVLAVHDRCLALVERGVLASIIEEIDWGPLVRARDETGPDDVAGVDARREPHSSALEAAGAGAGSVMTRWGAIEYTDIAGVRGPLLIVRAVEGVGWDEYVTVRVGGRSPSGTASCSRWIATWRSCRSSRAPSGSGRRRTRVQFSGSPFTVPVGPDWLGRVCNGRGVPIDGGPPIRGTRSPPRRAHP